MYFQLSVGVLCLSLFCCALLCVHFSIAINLKRKRKLVALLLLSYRCIATLNVLLVTVPWVGLLCVIVVFPDHIHLLFTLTKKKKLVKTSFSLMGEGQTSPLMHVAYFI